ncbi:fused MFS/spermidine synthase [Candidatus Parcubacteria bacterium]|nr:fused MFS/spermidine synthase [Candidatus Parcubacteria bacterium]
MQDISIKKLYFIVFSTGAFVMILELIGSRILAPVLGTSIFIWTSLIGIILGALSLGYYFGGKLADKNPNTKTFSSLIFFSGIFVFFIIVAKEFILEISFFLGMKNGAVFSSIFLFAIPSFFLGTVSPYAARLAMKKVEDSGKTIGNLYAVSTFGSIVGTFLAGFYLIPNFGSTNILYAITIGLLVISLFAYQKREKIGILFLVFIVVFGFSVVSSAFNQEKYLVDEDTLYGHIRIYDKEGEDDRTIRVMSVENFFDSGMILGSDELAFEYTKYYRLDGVFKDDIKRVVLFGGAAYSVAKDFLLRNREGKIDVVEIDPKTTEFAEKYFNLDVGNERLIIYHQDARIFLNNVSRNNNDKYDIVYNDAFSSNCSAPFHLTTREAIEKMYNILNNDGVYITNIISAISGKKSEFFRVEYKTIAEKFENVFVFATRDASMDQSETVQNIMIIATKENVDIDEMIDNNRDEDIAKLLDKYWKYEIQVNDVKILTDDYAPVEHYTSKLCIF